MTFGNYPFFNSVFYSFTITILSTILILLCTSMCAWYLSRVDNFICKVVYYLCVFSMVVPFQMVMFTLSKTADTLNLNTPYTIPIIYLGFGAGLAVFMFSGFVKSMPLSVEEAASIDGCGLLRTFFQVVLPIMRPTIISVGIIEIMWIWNDYLLPMIVAKQGTIQLAQMRFNGQFMKDYGPMCASLTISSIPIILFYLSLQKYIIKGIAAGAVKG